MSSLNLGLLERLLFAKALFIQGEKLSTSLDFASENLAVLCFQDSVEMCLRVVAEHLNAAVAPQENFVSLIDKIDKSGQNLPGCPAVPLRSALLQMNDARVGFKHRGNPVAASSLRKWSTDTARILEETSRSFLGVDFRSVSPSTLIRHVRTRRLVASAERYREAGDISHSILESTRAFEVCLASALPFDESGAAAFLGRGGSSTQQRDLVEALKSIDEKFEILAYGIPMADYYRFKDLTPTMSRTYGEHWFRGQWRAQGRIDEESAKFCTEFVTTCALEIQRRQRLRPEKKVKRPETHSTQVLEVAEIVFVPCDYPERIRVVQPGDNVEAAKEPSSAYPDHVAVYADEEWGYIPKTALRLRAALLAKPQE